MTSNKNENTAKRKIPEEAYDWMAILQSGDVLPEEFEEYLQWREADPAHAAAMDELEKTWDELATVSFSDPRMRHETPSARRMSERLLDLFTGDFRLKYPVRSAAAVAFAVVLGLFVFTLWPGPAVVEPQHFVTHRAEMRTVHLDDGTAVHLNALSSIRVDYSGEERHVVLEKGEALFDVAHDPLKPFIVYAGEGEVQAIGTKFNVALSPDYDVEVTLVEGVIKVARTRGEDRGTIRFLKVPGERVSFSHLEKDEEQSEAEKALFMEVIPPDQTSLEEILSWRKGKLIFNGERLENALYEINRHSKHSIVLKDEKIADLSVYAVFNAGDWRSALSAIEKSFPVYVVQISDHETILLPRDEK